MSRRLQQETTEETERRNGSLLPPFPPVENCEQGLGGTPLWSYGTPTFISQFNHLHAMISVRMRRGRTLRQNRQPC